MREKINPISILLRSVQQVDYAISKLSSLPVNDKNPIEVIFREKPKSRGLNQNAYYFMRVGEIANQAWMNGKQFNADVWHRYLKLEIMQETVTLKDGSVVSKWIELPNYQLDVISTTKLEKKCFAEYTLLVEVFGAGLGVKFKDRGYNDQS